jgi:hypothetical protein
MRIVEANLPEIEGSEQRGFPPCTPHGNELDVAHPGLIVFTSCSAFARWSNKAAVEVGKELLQQGDTIIYL